MSLLAKTLLLGAAALLIPINLQAETIDFKQTVVEVNERMQQFHYNPQELQQTEYLQMLEKMQHLGANASNKKDFVEQFNQLWIDGPFSHVRIAEARQSAEALADYLDTMNVGGNGASLVWQEEIAVLSVNTMMGMDTIEQIKTAYNEIVDKQAKALIIDLRRNNGGAFAVKPLVGHLITEPLDAGTFVSQSWNKENQTPPGKKDIEQVTPWQGWSIKSFWKDAQENAITRIQFQPAAPHYSGKVFVLTSSNTASAAELATDALANLPNVTIVGERTQGQMLSQKMYDLSGGMQLFLPIADYYAYYSGRIEGKGVAPDIKTEADNAMAAAAKQISAF